MSIPVIANGNVFEYEDFKRIKEATGLYVRFIFYALLYIIVILLVEYIKEKLRNT